MNVAPRILVTALSRRQFAQFLGAGAVVAVGTRALPNWLTARAGEYSGPSSSIPFFNGPPLQSLPATDADTLTLAPGMRYQVLLRQGDLLNPNGDRYGDHNDYLAHIVRSPNEGWLWVNHEKASLSFIEDDWTRLSTRAQAATMLKNMGGSCLRMHRTRDGSWRPILPDRRNVRLDGLSTRFRLTGPARGSSFVGGVREVTGTVGNCGGGVSPWGTFFSAEENFQTYFADPEIPEVEIDAKDLQSAAGSESAAFEQPMLVQAFFPRPASHYGYMVEFDPDTGQCWKHTSLGRFSHENVAFTTTKDHRLVCYLGDDRMGQCLYKFVSNDRLDSSQGKANRRLLEHGMLFVADTERGRWIALDPAQQPALRKAGFDAARVCVHTRTAARLAGGTPHARPEDVEVHPVTGEVYVCITAHQPGKPAKGVAYTSEVKGALGRIREASGDAGAMEFHFDLFVVGNRETGLTWPDNIAFGERGDLVVTSDFKLQPGKPLPNSAQEWFGNNYLMLIPTVGPDAGRVTRIATGPRGSELCSPVLSPDRSELWLNVQHPGEGSKTRETLSSHWPDGGASLPRSCLVAIERISAP